MQFRSEGNHKFYNFSCGPFLIMSFFQITKQIKNGFEAGGKNHLKSWTDFGNKTSKRANRSHTEGRMINNWDYSNGGYKDQISKQPASFTSLELLNGLTKKNLIPEGTGENEILSRSNDTPNKSRSKGKDLKSRANDCDDDEEDSYNRSTCLNLFNPGGSSNTVKENCEFEKRFARGVAVLTAHAQEQDEKEKQREEWKFASEVLDRVFKLLFLFVFIILHVTVFLSK